MLYLGIFGQNFNKAIVIFEIKHPQIYLFAKSHEKTKMPKFGTKNALFGYFWATILKELLPYLKSATLQFA